MKVLIFSDLHNHAILPDVKPDLILLLGDIEWTIVKDIDKKYDCTKFGVLGNHDRHDTFVRTNIINLHENVENFNGYTIAGFSGCPRYNNREFGQYDEGEVARFTKKLKNVDIFIAHSNPMWKINFNKTDGHRGFQSFSDFIDEKQPKYFFHGHIHENKIRKHRKTEVISVYSYLEIEINSKENA